MMLLLLIVILVLIMLTATLFESVFGMEHYAAGYAALALWGTGIIAIIWFYLFTAKGCAIVRTWNIKDIRKKRIERDFHESWRRANRNSISKENMKLIREIDRMTKDPDDDEAAAVAAACAYHQSHSSNG